MNPDPDSSPSQPQPMASARGDLRRLRTNSSATVAELRSFLKHLQGKSPQEMLGVVASSQLIRATCLSTVIVLAGALLGTAIPFAMGAGKDKDSPKDAPTGPVAAEPAIPKPEPSPAAVPSSGPDTAPTPTPTPTPAPAPAPEANLSNLGVNEEKKAPPNVNPLENNKDNFLEGLE